MSNFATLLGELVADTFCWIHNEMEPRSEKPYLICFECGHVYETEVDLERDFNVELAGNILGQPLARRIEPLPAADICFCPHCLHDF